MSNMSSGDKHWDVKIDEYNRGETMSIAGDHLAENNALREEIARLKHDLERALANHSADLSARPEGAVIPDGCCLVGINQLKAALTGVGDKADWQRSKLLAKIADYERAPQAHEQPKESK